MLGFRGLLAVVLLSALAAPLIAKPAPEVVFDQTWNTREGVNKLSDLRGTWVLLEAFATW